MAVGSDVFDDWGCVWCVGCCRGEACRLPSKCKQFSKSVEGRSSMAGCYRTRVGDAGWSLAVGTLTLDVGEWAEENSGECELGDPRSAAASRGRRGYSNIPYAAMKSPMLRRGD